MGVEVGTNFKLGVKKNTNAWGGAAIALGAGDQFEANSESLKANAELIMNEGVYGALFRRAGVPGNLKPGGALDLNLYYLDAGWRFLAAAMGADAVTSLGGGAYRHDITQANAHYGVNFTTAMAGNEGVFEMPCAKVKGFKLSASEGKMLTIAPELIGFDRNLNVGSPSTASVVATAAAANGVKTIAAQPTIPSPLTLTLTGVTELITTIVYTNIRGDQVTEVHTRSTGGLTFTTAQYCAPGGVLSITSASIAGSGNFSAGVSNGVNNATTAAALSTAAERNLIVFSQADIYVNAQGGADFVAATDEQFLAGFDIGMDMNMDQRVTSEFQYRISEPSAGGGGYPSTTLDLHFSAYSDKNRRYFWDQLSKGQLKAKIVLTGPPISGASVPNSLTLWLNGLQAKDAQPNMGGAGVLPMDVSLEANSVLAAPTGFPAGHVNPLMAQLVNTLSTSYLA